MRRRNDGIGSDFVTRNRHGYICNFVDDLTIPKQLPLSRTFGSVFSGVGSNYITQTKVHHDNIPYKWYKTPKLKLSF